jgi:hypothetical protein
MRAKVCFISNRRPQNDPFLERECEQQLPSATNRSRDGSFRHDDDKVHLETNFRRFRSYLATGSAGGQSVKVLRFFSFQFGIDPPVRSSLYENITALYENITAASR